MSGPLIRRGGCNGCQKATEERKRKQKEIREAMRGVVAGTFRFPKPAGKGKKGP